MESKIKIGLIINPIAGMGGKVALKGTDGEEILKMALQMGAVQTSQLKAERALKQLESLNNYTIFTSNGSMGESCCKKLGLNYKIIYNANEKTESADTQKLAEELVNKECSLIIFVGGDGTARDVCRSENSIFGFCFQSGKCRENIRLHY